MSAEEDAFALWNAFQTDPAGTYAAIGRQLESHGYSTRPADYDEMRSWYMQQRQATQEQQELAAYDATLDMILGQPENADINRQRIHGFVAAADGDFDRAVQMYREDDARAQVQAAEMVKRQLGWSDEQFQAAMRCQAPPVSGGAASEYQPGVEDPRDALHRAIEIAARRR